MGFSRKLPSTIDLAEALVAVNFENFHKQAVEAKLKLAIELRVFCPYISASSDFFCKTKLHLLLLLIIGLFLTLFHLKMCKKLFPILFFATVLSSYGKEVVAACYDHAFDMRDPGVCDVIND